MVATKRLEGQALYGHPVALAVMAVIRERGYELASCEEFARRAGMDLAEFEHQFADKADATDRVFEALNDNFKTRVGLAYSSLPNWPESLRAAAYEAARWLRDNPMGTWFGMVGTLDAGDLPRVRREEAFKWCAGLIDEGRSVSPDPDAVPAAAPLMAVGAIAEMLRRQQEGTFHAETVETVAPLMCAAVRPYLGEEAAQAELSIPPPSDLSGEEPPRTDGR